MQLMKSFEMIFHQIPSGKDCNWSCALKVTIKPRLHYTAKSSKVHVLCILLFSTFCSHSLWSKVSNGTIAFPPPCSGLAPDKVGKVLLFNTTGGRKCDRFAVTATLNLPGGSGI